MSDATTAARDRIDRALALLERKVLDLKARAAAAAVADDDLFAMPAQQSAGDPDRIAVLEAAGRDASVALAAAASAIRNVLDEDAPQADRVA